MALFQLDGVTVAKDPTAFEWEPPVVLDIDHSGAPIYGAYRSARCTFNVLTNTQFNEWLLKDDGATHSVRLPSPGTATFTTYTGVYVRCTNNQRAARTYVYGAEITITHISV